MDTLLIALLITAVIALPIASVVCVTWVSGESSKSADRQNTRRKAWAIGLAVATTIGGVFSWVLAALTGYGHPLWIVLYGTFWFLMICFAGAGDESSNTSTTD